MKVILQDGKMTVAETNAEDQPGGSDPEVGERGLKGC